MIYLLDKNKKEGIQFPWIHFPSFFSYQESEFWKANIVRSLEWGQPIVKVYGKQHPVPRLTSFLADKPISYKYSGTIHEASQWPTWFIPLLRKVSKLSNTKFNGCLLNLYRNGNDRMGWHADNENELDSEQNIASLSFGATRDFLLKSRKDSLIKSIQLKNGDCLLMYPKCQLEWVHSVPIRRKCKDARVNLTFRCYRNC